MYKLVLANNYEFEIKEGFSLGNIIHISKTDADSLEVSRQVTKANVKHIKFYCDDALIGEYNNLTLITAPIRYDNADGTITVSIGLRTMTDIEARLEELESTQAIQDGAIEDLGEVVSGLMDSESSEV